MSDGEGLPQPVQPPERMFAAELAKQGRAKCKRCKQPCEAGQLRVARMVPNAFSSSGGWTKAWHHPSCLWEAFAKQRATTKKVDDPSEDIDGWDDLPPEDQNTIIELIRASGGTGTSLP